MALIKLISGKKLSRSVPVRERFFRSVFPEPNSGCWLWVGQLCALKYGAIDIDGKEMKAHRLSYEMFRGPIPDGQLVRHKCDNTFCVNPDHLEIGSHTDNMRDMYERGRNRQVSGDKHHKAILNDKKVAEIRGLLKTGISGAELARQYGVSVSTVSLINRGKIWRHVR